MAINRQDRIGKENINSINQIEQYISSEYLQIIQDKLTELKLKKIEIDNKITLYNSLSNTNNLIINELKTNTKYTTIVNNQAAALPLIDEVNILLKTLNDLLNYKDIITLDNLASKELLYSTNKVSIIEGEFTQLQIEDPANNKGAVNKRSLQKELDKIEQPPLPLQRLKYLATDSQGNLIWQ